MPGLDRGDRLSPLKEHDGEAEGNYGMPLTVRATVGALAAIVILGAAVGPAQAQYAGDRVVTGSTDLLFRGGEFAELVGATVIHLLFAALEDSVYYYDHHEGCYDGHCSEEIDPEVSATQLGTSLGYFVSPRLSLGGRLELRSNDRHVEGGATGGIGPELTYYFNGNGGSASPFVGAGFLYTRALRQHRDHFADVGGSLLLKSGVQARLSPAASFFVQVSYRSSQRRNALGEREARWGLGFGFSGFLR